MEKGSTKQDILNTALEMFSVQGFEATSISQLAEAVGIRKASMYSHFASKQEILDALIEQVLEGYEKHSLFAKAAWDDPAYTENMQDMTPEKAVQMLQGQVLYILHDPQVSRARKMLTIGQFRNPQMAAMQTKQNYTDVMKYCTGLVCFLISQGKLEGSDAEIMAAELSLPISVWINLCDREPDRENEAMALMERHIRQFFKLYQKKSRDKA